MYGEDGEVPVSHPSGENGMAPRFTLSLLKQHRGNMSLVMKRKSFGWNWMFLLQLLGLEGTWCVLALPLIRGVWDLYQPT